MYHLLIVETNKPARSIWTEKVDWKTLDFELLDRISNLQLAINFISSHVIHLLIIIMNPPFSEGFQLIRILREMEFKGEIIVLSNKHPFKVVRQVFKLKVDDYLLVSEFTPHRVASVLNEVKYKLMNCPVQEVGVAQKYKKEAPKIYYCFVIILEAIGWFKKRMGNIQQDIVISIIERLNEIPRIREHGEVVEYNAAQIVITYTDACKEEDIKTLAIQIRQAIMTYFGIEVAIGISDYIEKTSYVLAKEKARTYLTLRYIHAERFIFTKQEAKELKLDIILEKKNEYKPLLKSLTAFNHSEMLKIQQELFEGEIYQNLDICKTQCRMIIYYEALMLERSGDSLWNVWGKRVVFEKKLQRLVTSNDMIMWISNYNEFLLDYLKNRFKKHIHNNKLVRVQEYIESNYHDHFLSLKQVACAVGLNESYLSSQFKKTFQISFVEYVTKVRIERAEQMISYTNMKVYEIGKAVGYMNVEHFVRVFKKKVGMPPKQYRAQSKM